MPDLIFKKITGHHVRLHVADSAVPEGVHSTWNDAKKFADWRENTSANIPIF
jgi:hypothetical protein